MNVIFEFIVSRMCNVPNLIFVAQLFEKLWDFHLKFKLPVVELAQVWLQVSVDVSLNSKEELITFEIIELE